jgi:hypothetical protein
MGIIITYNYGALYLGTYYLSQAIDAIMVRELQGVISLLVKRNIWDPILSPLTI